MNRAVVAIGSNVDPERHVAAALARLAAGLTVRARSALVRTRPVGPPDRPEYLNGAVLVETAMGRAALKAYLRGVEADLGRTRTADRYAPRTIDLDIVVWNGEVVDDDVRVRPYLRAAVREVWPDLPLAP